MKLVIVDKFKIRGNFWSVLAPWVVIQKSVTIWVLLFDRFYYFHWLLAL